MTVQRLDKAWHVALWATMLFALVLFGMSAAGLTGCGATTHSIVESPQATVEVTVTPDTVLIRTDAQAKVWAIPIRVEVNADTAKECVRLTVSVTGYQWAWDSEGCQEGQPLREPDSPTEPEQTAP